MPRHYFDMPLFSSSAYYAIAFGHAAITLLYLTAMFKQM